MATTPKSTSKTNVTALTVIYTVPAATTSIVTGLYISDRVGAASSVTCTYFNSAGATTANLTFSTYMGANGTLVVLDSNSRLVMNTGDILRVSASSAVDVTMSFLEIT